ncbi:site-specific DNA-methyltransferase [Actinomyces sp. 432]|uniref:site-specific DNA-methyltransferase n=1 Tax=Actinomyces sp. 432 TaxID=2057798 RepID=UPI00192A5120|nr:site-specific DNA-methyltransferase [Actinomyces sp. 432]
MITPYYSDDLVTLYHGDCREITDWLTGDVLVTDPPYGMRYRNGQVKLRDDAPIVGDESTDMRDAALALWGAEKPGLAFGRWSVQPPDGEVMRLIWHKAAAGPGMGDLTMPWGTNYEQVHVIGRGWDITATGRHRRGAVYTTREARGGAGGEAAKLGHPTPKPVGLMEQLIGLCPPGTIADPFAGGGRP